MRVEAAAPRPCSRCPWRTTNQGRRHPGGWYTKSNLRRLWVGLRRGERMTCHPTDPSNPVPEGLPAVSAGARTRECTGALVLQQREFMRAQEILLAGGSVRDYRAAFPGGLTLAGLVAVAERYVFGGTPLHPGVMSRPDLNQEDVGHPDLPAWEPVRG